MRGTPITWNLQYDLLNPFLIPDFSKEILYYSINSNYFVNLLNFSLLNHFAYIKSYRYVRLGAKELIKALLPIEGSNVA